MKITKRTADELCERIVDWVEAVKEGDPDIIFHEQIESSRFLNSITMTDEEEAAIFEACKERGERQ